MTLMRRGGAVLAAAILALPLTACGGDDGAEKSAGTSSENAAEETGSAVPPECEVALESVDILFAGEGAGGAKSEVTSVDDVTASGTDPLQCSMTVNIYATNTSGDSKDFSMPFTVDVVEIDGEPSVEDFAMDDDLFEEIGTFLGA